MASKEQKPSKKAVLKKKEKAIEDNTFGLKNKNKSKKVQQFINRVEKSVKHSGNGLEMEKARELKKETKLMKQLQEEELRQLLASAITNQHGMKKSKANEVAAKLGLTASNNEVSKFLDDLSSDSSSDEEEENGEYIKDNWDDDGPGLSGGIEVFREKTIEDIIEEQRAKLAQEGKKGTPVTEVSFAKWKEEKVKRKQAEAEARLKSEQTKKKGGKGLSVLSGKELFNYNASLFIDDESAFDTSNDQVLNDEMKALQEKEELQILEEYQRAQAEQSRLAEIQKAEDEARKYREADRRAQAKAKDRKTFTFNGIVCTDIIFGGEDEEEDLELFADEIFAPDTSRVLSSSQENELVAMLSGLSLKEQELQVLKKKALEVLARLSDNNQEEESDDDDDDDEDEDNEDGEEGEGDGGNDEEGGEDDDADS